MEPRHLLWFMIADGGRARIVRPEPHSGRLRIVARFESAAIHLRASDLGSDRPGRSFESASATRHMIEPRHDPHRAEAEHFVQKLADYLNEAAARRAYDRLVLVAPGRVMHTLLQSLQEAAARCVFGVLRKDLTHVTDDQLPEHLREWMPPLVAGGA